MSQPEGTDLYDTWSVGRAAWPTVDLAPENLAAFLTEKRVPAQSIRAHAADLYLAAACVAGIPEALACFDATFLSQVDRYLSRMSLAADLVDEVRQRLRIRMIGHEARIGRYVGTAPLDRWLRLACVRLALDIIDSETRHPAASFDELAERVACTDNPELNAILARYTPIVQQQLKQAIERLSERDRTLLRLYFVEGLNVDSIGTIYRVHRASAARWIGAIRSHLLDQVCGHLQLNIGLTHSEAASLVNCVRGELALSLTRLLAP